MSLDTMGLPFSLSMGAVFDILFSQIEFIDGVPAFLFFFF